MVDEFLNKSNDSDLLHISLSINEGDRTVIQCDIHDDIESIIERKILTKQLQQKQGECLKNYVFAWVNKIRAKKNHNYFARALKINNYNTNQNESQKNEVNPGSNQLRSMRKISSINAENKIVERKKEKKVTIKEISNSEKNSFLNPKNMRLDSNRSLSLISKTEPIILAVQNKPQINMIRNLTIKEESYDSSTSKNNERKSISKEFVMTKLGSYQDQNVKELTQTSFNKNINSRFSKLAPRSYFEINNGRRDTQLTINVSNAFKNIQNNPGYKNKNSFKKLKSTFAKNNQTNKSFAKNSLKCEFNISFSLIGFSRALKIIQYSGDKYHEKLNKEQKILEIIKRNDMINKEIEYNQKMLDSEFETNSQEKSRNFQKSQISTLYNDNKVLRKKKHPNCLTKFTYGKFEKNKKKTINLSNDENSNLSTSGQIFLSLSDLSRNNSKIEKARSFFLKDVQTNLDILLKESLEKIFENFKGKYPDKPIVLENKNAELIFNISIEEMKARNLEMNFTNFCFIAKNLLCSSR